MNHSKPFHLLAWIVLAGASCGEGLESVQPAGVDLSVAEIVGRVAGGDVTLDASADDGLYLTRGLDGVLHLRAVSPALKTYDGMLFAAANFISIQGKSLEAGDIVASVTANIVEFSLTVDMEIDGVDFTLPEATEFYLLLHDPADAPQIYVGPNKELAASNFLKLTSDGATPDCTDGVGSDCPSDPPVVDGTSAEIEFFQDFEGFNPQTELSEQQIKDAFDRITSGTQNNADPGITVVADPADSGRSNVMRVFFPEGELRNSASGGAWQTRLSPRDEYYFAYDVYVPLGFEWPLGIKIPGLFGGDLGAASGTKPTNGVDGFAVRQGISSERQPGDTHGYSNIGDGVLAASTYTYDGSTVPRRYNAALNNDWDGAVKLNPGSWTRIEQRVVLNDATNVTGSGVGANGIYEAWVDGVKVFEESDWTYRTNASLQIDHISFIWYYGGNHDDYGAREDQSMFFDNFVVSTQPITHGASVPDSSCANAGTQDCRNGDLAACQCLCDAGDDLACARLPEPPPPASCPASSLADCIGGATAACECLCNTGDTRACERLASDGGGEDPPASSADVLIAMDFESSELGEYSATDIRNDWASQPGWSTANSMRKNSIVDLNGDRVLQVLHPQGVVHASGHFNVYFPAGYEELYLSYRVLFQSDFHFRVAGKLPRLRGGTQTACDGPPPAGFTTAVNWVKWQHTDSSRGMLSPYVYHLDQPGMCGQGASTDASLDPGVWHDVVIYVRMNTVGQANGEMTLWLDGEEAYSRSSYRFRDDPGLQIDHFYFLAGYGTGDREGSPPIKDEYSYYDDFVISTAPLGAARAP